jgi:Arc/MetJ family transcription regulator
MRTTLNLDDRLIERAMQLTGIKEKTALIHAALKALIARERPAAGRVGREHAEHAFNSSQAF